MVAGVGIGRYEHWYGCGSSSNNSWGLQAIVSAVIDFVQDLLFSRREERGLHRLFEIINPTAEDIEQLNSRQLRRLHSHVSGFDMSNKIGFDLSIKMKIWFQRISLDENQNAYNAFIKRFPDNIRDELIDGLTAKNQKVGRQGPVHGLGKEELREQERCKLFQEWTGRRAN